MMSSLLAYLQLETLFYRLLAFLLAATVHDFIYAYAVQLLGDRTAREQGRLTWNPAAHITPLGLSMLLFGPYGWTKPMPIDPGRFKNARKLRSIAAWLAAPLANLLLCLIFWWLYRSAGTEVVTVSWLNELWLGFLQFSVMVNLFYAILHIMPIYPLGGWFALQAMLGRKPADHAIISDDSMATNQGKPFSNRRLTLGETLGLCFTIIMMAFPLGRSLLSELYVIVERWIGLLF